MTAIRIEDLKKQYGQVKALDGLTLSVEPGTVFGFLGPNGAGKTTTLRLLTGLAQPTSGKAWVAGIDIADRHGLAEIIGYLPEEPAFYPWMTPFEFLDYVARVFGLPTRERKSQVRELLEQVGLADVSKRRIGGFSRGMRQRLGLAQALVNRPLVLLMDEPVSALDPAGRKEVLELIVRLRGSCTVFMSTHILADVERVCDTVGIINHGRLVTEARQADLLARYTTQAFEVEVEPAAADALKTWCESLHSLAWIRKVDLDGVSARVLVNDLDTARSSLLPLVFQSGLPVRRYEVVTPSLEDIFLRLVSQEERA
ncbi:MAG: ABC transporter ATP-binding protein [Anaerolineaceae bacterium]|nr:ABC transporter ATP-binding protein [Anaerolineaceae bacterium]